MKNEFIGPHPRLRVAVEAMNFSYAMARTMVHTHIEGDEALMRKGCTVTGFASLAHSIFIDLSRHISTSTMGQYALDDALWGKVVEAVAPPHPFSPPPPPATVVGDAAMIMNFCHVAAKKIQCKYLGEHMAGDVLLSCAIAMFIYVRRANIPHGLSDTLLLTHFEGMLNAGGGSGDGTGDLPL